MVKNAFIDIIFGWERMTTSQSWKTSSTWKYDCEIPKPKGKKNYNKEK